MTDSSRSTCVIARNVYVKAVCHAAAHPHDTVIGLVLGRVVARDQGKSIESVDALPLFHHWTDLSMASEAALELSRIYAKKKNFGIVGSYICYSNPGQSPESGGRFLDMCTTFRRDCPEAIAIIIDPRALKLDQPTNAFCIYAHEDEQWRSVRWSGQGARSNDGDATADARSVEVRLESEDCPTEAAKEIIARKHRLVVDFDDFVEGKGQGQWLT